MKPSILRRNAISVEQRNFTEGLQEIIPLMLRQQMLNDIHTDHLGIVCMKGLSLSYLWWPSLDSEIESMVKSCLSSIMMGNMPNSAPQHEWTSTAWKQVYMDFAKYNGCNYFVMMDAYSKWPEVYLMNSMTTSKAMLMLYDTCLQHIESLMTWHDNGPQFVSEEMKNFLLKIGVVHKRSLPYHPQTNGAAECLVQILEHHLKT